MSITSKIRKFLASKGATQGEAAAVLGVSEQTFSAKANGKSEFKASEIKLLAEKYGMSAEEIMGVFL